MTDYARPETLDHALGLLAAGGWRVLAGGTDLYPATPRRALDFAALDLTALPGMTAITETPEGLRIGAGATWSALAAADLPPACAALQHASRQVGGWQIQNAGTIGGNLCNASPAADGAPPLLVLEAELELASPRGPRRLPLAEFLTGVRQTALAVDELLLAVHLPRKALTGRSAFQKLGARAHLVISIAMVAARLRLEGGVIAELALSAGACAPTARRLAAAETACRGLPLAEALARITPDLLAADLAPIDDVRGSAAYRLEAAAELTRRTMEASA
ncbi:xanthine dehydrogenase family protein subunit M [Gemmobacter lutimaris]|uniref:Xanthine dehydrogenase family protein subunit M n=1 Tax=Gemmobacter lutimaris TaxID=2306023 RepID=A0A398BUD8_9RHOB|nr:FAD binding domain-containing protein [Gemmobacter lutimaris]RID93324.1 xanthine dehydrogenase family protein subunit M [Gemmobacter lutimaris]